MDDIIVSMNDNVLVPQDPANFVSPEQPVFVQENVVGGYSDPCTVEVGQTITGEPNTDASVVNVGSNQHAVLNFTIPRGADGADGIDGVDGLDGESATIRIGNVTSVDYDDPATVVNVGTSTHAILDFSLPRGQQGEQGLQGVAGSDGISPIAYVTQTASGATIVIEDSQNTTTANITNGVDGTDGFSPIATVTQGTGSATISITDANGTTTATVHDGTNGSDGFSPIATVTPTASGATISVTDAQGTTTANITNGIDGTNGVTPSITATASVDNTTGTPAVNVTKTGTDANPSFAFAFEHLKGQQGESGVMISAYNSGTSIAIAGTSTYIDILTVTVPEDGKYLMFFSGDIVANSQVYIKLVKNTTDIDDSLRANAYVGRHDMTCMAVYSCNKNDVIHAQGYATANSQARRAVLAIVRLSS